MQLQEFMRTTKNAFLDLLVHRKFFVISGKHQIQNSCTSTGNPRRATRHTLVRSTALTPERSTKKI